MKKVGSFSLPAPFVSYASLRSDQKDYFILSKAKYFFFHVEELKHFELSFKLLLRQLFFWLLNQRTKN